MRGPSALGALPWNATCGERTTKARQAFRPRQCRGGPMAQEPLHILAVEADAPYLPILMLTALDTPNYRQLGFSRGADDYVAKPFDLAELLARVRVWGATSRRIR